MKRTLSLLFCFFLPSLLLAQGLKIVNKVTTYEEKERTNTSTLYLTDKKVKTKSKSSNGRKTSSIFKKEDQVLYTIDHKNKRYTKITKEDIEQMEKLMKRMENMPESAKEMMGDKMDKMMKNDQPDITYKKTGNSKTVSPWGECQEWKGVDKKGNMLQKVYTTSRNQVKVKKSHFDILTDMIDFFSFMPKGMDRNYPVKTKKKGKKGLKGFGVLWIYYDKQGNKTQKMKVKEMKERSIKNSRFKVPSGYEANEINMGGGRR
ncbi:MAG: hypothetical protein ABEH38_09490 [Flavobacteriales bacterium]